jgi:hypothetical protein
LRIIHVQLNSICYLNIIRGSLQISAIEVILFTEKELLHIIAFGKDLCSSLFESEEIISEIGALRTDSGC